MIAQNNNDLAQMLQDDTFIQPIELRDMQYELDATTATIGKRIVGSHAYRCVLALHGTLDLRGRFYFDNVRFRVAPNMRGVNVAWGAHSVFTDCFFVSAKVGRIQDWSGKAKILAAQESHAMLKR